MTGEDQLPGTNADPVTTPDLHVVHEERYRDLIENLNDAVYSIDNNGIVTYVSPSFSKVTGFDPDYAIGKRYLDFIPDVDRPHMVRRFEEIREGTIMILEWRMRRGDGALYWVRTSSRPIFRDGIFSGIQGVITDIS